MMSFRPANTEKKEALPPLFFPDTTKEKAQDCTMASIETYSKKHPGEEKNVDDFGRCVAEKVLGGPEAAAADQ